MEQLSSPTRSHQLEDGRASGLQDGARSDGQLDSAPRGKRKYRRHPKVTNAFNYYLILRLRSTDEIERTTNMHRKGHHLPMSSSPIVGVTSSVDCCIVVDLSQKSEKN